MGAFAFAFERSPRRPSGAARPGHRRLRSRLQLPGALLAWVKKLQGLRWKLSTSTGITGQSCSGEGGGAAHPQLQRPAQPRLQPLCWHVWQALTAPHPLQTLRVCRPRHKAAARSAHLAAHDVREAHGVPQHAVRAVQAAVRLQAAGWGSHRIMLWRDKHWA